MLGPSCRHHFRHQPEPDGRWDSIFSPWRIPTAQVQPELYEKQKGEGEDP